MHKTLHTALWGLMVAFSATAQVTQINSNKSLDLITTLNTTKALFRSGPDGTIWVSEGTAASTIQLNPNISTGGQGAVLNGKFIFSGTTPVHGTDLFMTDGTDDGTIVLKDIFPNAGSSNPDDFIAINGFVYFTAERSGEGRELWRTNGTTEGTVLIKDINPGFASSNSGGQYQMAALGNQLLFAAKSNTGGIELWKSDGTSDGTVLLKDINTGDADSKPADFWPLGNVLLFTAHTPTNGREIWRTDGTTGGTYLLKDINPGAGSSTEIEVLPGFSYPILNGFHVFNQKAYFIAYDGSTFGNLFATDGTTANTQIVKVLMDATGFPFVPLITSINFPGKFFFSLSDGNARSEIWQSDGTTAGTTVFKSFEYNEDDPLPLLFKNFNGASMGSADPLFQGTTFFFTAHTPAEGNELWKSDGTLPGTVLVKDIRGGAASGVGEMLSYMYTNTALFFAATNGTQGIELWRSDGSANGTLLVQDIWLGASSAEPLLMTLHNGKVYFGANDGNSLETDLFVVDGNFTPLPATLSNFSVVRSGADARIAWETTSESNTSHFTIERSTDGHNFSAIGTTHAAGQSGTLRSYQYTDVKIVFPSTGILYYRLVTNDKDGKKSYSKVVPLAGQSGKWNARMLGNTPGSQPVLQLDALQQPVTIKISDLSGKTLHTQTYDARQWNINLPVQMLPGGMYFVTVTHGSEVKTLRFVK